MKNNKKKARGSQKKSVGKNEKKSENVERNELRREVEGRKYILVEGERAVEGFTKGK
jgi:hypothetical protein